MTHQWYALHSKPNMEAMLRDQLLDRDLEVYYPSLRVKPVNPRSRKEIPYFPGYLFASLDLTHFPLSKIAWLPGMRRVVAFDGEPATVPDHLILALQKQVDLASQRLADPFTAFQPGSPIRIQSGPFAGFEGIFDTRINGSERARVLIHFLRHAQLTLEVPMSQLAFSGTHS